ncbi:MAG: exodeoxyribonuclease VII small subunit [Euryhalocaulis sp.]|uniref:exodeoxyribonuclease VII small subunit n=1 Tax=Euryhalocaulis sp. TaxID=2744307 RepID=UPI0018359BAE|nr:exodeoxyribonuclease VII small subunit [Euryhalocaulis sp.]MBA4800542.1 exodeoxyribonuclease VII small subunit [Euryhalocaulis sp.]
MSDTAEKSPPDVSTLSFEAALKELESIVEKLERGDVELEESIAIYERGAALKKHCEDKLKAAQMKVDKIVFDEDGAPKAEPAGLD